MAETPRIPADPKVGHPDVMRIRIRSHPNEKRRGRLNQTLTVSQVLTNDGLSSPIQRLSLLQAEE
jgi:hypothetical protein